MLLGRSARPVDGECQEEHEERDRSNLLRPGKDHLITLDPVVLMSRLTGSTASLTCGPPAKLVASRPIGTS